MSDVGKSTLAVIVGFTIGVVGTLLWGSYMLIVLGFVAGLITMFFLALYALWHG